MILWRHFQRLCWSHSNKLIFLFFCGWIKATNSAQFRIVAKLLNFEKPLLENIAGRLSEQSIWKMKDKH